MFAHRSTGLLSTFLLAASITACGGPKAAGEDDASVPDDDDGDAGEDSLGIMPEDLPAGEASCLPGQNDCPEGEKCQPYVSTPGECCVDAAQCVPLIGDKGVGEPCTRNELDDDCGRDKFCFAGTSGKTGPGFCKQLCDGNDPYSCAAVGLPEARCVPYNDGILPLCETPCHPLRPDACQDGQGCYPGGALGFNCNWPDPEPGKGNDHDDCHTVQSCVPGLYCASGASLEGCTSDNCCTKFCDLLGNGSECTAPENCVSLFDDEDGAPDPSLEDVGGCVLADDGG